jgi:hypothetical protein
MNTIEEQIADPSRQYIGLDVNDLGTLYNSILQTTLLADCHSLVICNPTPEDRDFTFMELAKASGHTVFLVVDKQHAPKQTRWLELSEPLEADSVEAPLPTTTESNAAEQSPRFTEDRLEILASMLMVVGIVFMGLGYVLSLKMVIWWAIPMYLGSIAIIFYSRKAAAIHCFVIFWLVLASILLALSIG